MQHFTNQVAVITGAASGFGREFARQAAALGMKLALADIQPEALETVATELRANGAEVLALRTDVSQAADMESFAEAVFAQFGRVHLLFNNAGVAAGGLLWENTARDWEWVLGVNLWSVVHGIRLFVPRMIAQGDDCHVVNTASAAGLISAPLLGVYNVSKHAVVTLSETLYHDLRQVRAHVGVSVLCPAFVNTGISQSHRNRPPALRDAAPPTQSQLLAQSITSKAVQSGRLTAAEVVAQTFACVEAGQFYCIPHKGTLASVEVRAQDIMALRNPTDPYGAKPDAR
jgi:NADP-dependent 3-hydroxy acid dehydrogenase YdfG